MTSQKKQNIKVAVDAVIFTIQRGQLMTLLIQMKKKPHSGKWAFPGGLLRQNETTEAAAARILKEQTSVSDVYLEQLATFSDTKRDSTGRVVSVAYFALISGEGMKLKTTDKYQDVRWWPIKKLPSLAYDHKEISKVALNRLQAKLEYSNLAWSLLEREFTLTDLQDVYETILDRKLDKRNFRKKILSLNLILQVGRKRRGGAHRPAELYRFKQRKLEYIDIL